MIRRHYVLVAALAIAGASFVGGYCLGARGGQGAPPEVTDEAALDRNTVGAGGVLSALVGGKSQRGGTARVGGNLREIAHDGKLGIFVKLRAYLRLANSTPLDELDDLLERMAREVPQEMGGEALCAIIAKRWAKADPRGAFTALLAGEPKALENSRDEVVAAFAEVDPDAAWEMVLAIESSKRRGRMFAVLLNKFGRDDIDATMVRLAEMDSPMLHRHELRQFIENQVQQHPATILQSLDELPARLVDFTFYAGAFSALANRDLAEAIAQLDEVRDTNKRIHAMSGLVSVWAQTDLSAATAWASQLPTVSQRDAMLYALLNVQLSNDPAAAAEAVSNLRSPRRRADISKNIARIWFATDKDAVLKWVDETLAGSARMGAIENLLGLNGGELEFERQLQFANQIPGDGKARRDFAERWAEDDPAAAAEWAAAQGAENHSLLSEVYERWIESDLDAAEAFVGSISNGQLRGQTEGWVKRARGAQVPREKRNVDVSVDNERGN